MKKGVEIVHPGQLARDRQLDVCSQCHSPALHHRGEWFDYRPGEELNTHFRSLTIEGVENDHVAHQEKYLRRSKCFEHSDSLSCNTCHDPHQPTDVTQVAAACAKCHQPADCRSRESLPAAVRDRCVDCHMLAYNRTAVKFRSAEAQYVFPMRPHEHRIAVYPRAQQAIVLEWHRGQDTPADQTRAAELTTQLVASWMREGDELRTEHRFVAAIGAYREALRFATDAAVERRHAENVGKSSAATGRNPERKAVDGGPGGVCKGDE